VAKSKRIGGLGKGLQALIPDIPDMGIAEGQGAERKAGEQTIKLELVSMNPYQPRRVFDEEKLQELTASIKEHGVVQPVLARPFGDGYQLIAGERRVRAARQAGLLEIPALIREMTDHELMEISLVENIQRQGLDPVEEARAYKRLSDEFGLTQEQIAKRVSKSRPYIANSIRLLALPDPILEHLVSGALTAGHVRPLLMLKEKDALDLAGRLIDREATVREAEQWAKELSVYSKENPPGEEPGAGIISQGATGGRQEQALPVELKEIQRILRDIVNTKVEIVRNAKGGKIIIDYYTQDDIERILELFTNRGV
jgi:ParB family chromosome partitioning protein